MAEEAEFNFAGAIGRKYGPLPGWAWAGLAGAGALGWRWWRARSAKAAGVDQSGTDATAADQGESAGLAASDQTGYGASFSVLQSEIQDLQGAMARTNTTPTTTPTTGSTTPTGTVKPPPTTKPPAKPPTPTPAAKYTTVTVGKFTEPNPPWDSTLSGIAAHYHVPGGYQALAKLNGIQNANLIHEGQKIKVPV